MNTNAFVSMIMDEAPDWALPQILLYTNEAQRMIFNHELFDNLMIDEATGTFPVVSYVPGQLKYYVGLQNGQSRDAWRIIKAVGLGDGLDGVELTGAYYYDDTGKGASVQFTEDPGTDFTVIAYRQPLELTSVNVGLEVPSNLHMTTLKRITMMLLEEAENGAPSQDRPMVERVMLPKAWNQMSQGGMTYEVVGYE